jgi:hypothetical protein
MKNRCKNCLFCEVLDYDEVMFGDADCHRFPPTVLQNTTNRACSVPRVFEDDWCGEWQPKQKRK